MIDKPRLLLATALALEDEPIYPTLKAVLIVGKGIEVETNEAFAVFVAQASWEYDARKTKAVVRAGTEEEATRRSQCGRIYLFLLDGGSGLGGYEVEFEDMSNNRCYSNWERRDTYMLLSRYFWVGTRRAGVDVSLSRSCKLAG